MNSSTLLFPRVVFLDLDGVITDTFWIHERGWSSILALYGKINTKECWLTYRGVPTKQAIIQLLEEYSIEYDEKDLEFLVLHKITIRDYLINRINKTSVLPISESVLRCADQLSIEVVCLATTTAAERILKRLGIIVYFDEVICGPRLSVPKKDGSDGILTYAVNRDISLGEVLFIDDDWRAVYRSRVEGIPSLHIDEANECLQNIECNDIKGIETMYAEATKIQSSNLITKDAAYLDK